MRGFCKVGTDRCHYFELTWKRLDIRNILVLASLFNTYPLDTPWHLAIRDLSYLAEHRLASNEAEPAPV